MSAGGKPPSTAGLPGRGDVEAAAPLLAAGAILLGVAFSIRAFDATVGAGRLPLWVLVLGMGVIALAGGGATLVLRPASAAGGRTSRPAPVRPRTGAARPLSPVPRGEEPPAPPQTVPGTRPSAVPSAGPARTSAPAWAEEPSRIPEELPTPAIEGPAASAATAEPSVWSEEDSVAPARPAPSSGAGPEVPASPGPGLTECATCGRVLPAREAWRRCQSCGRTLCVSCLTESVRRFGSGYCRSCSGETT